MTDDSLDLLCIKYDGWQPRIRPGTPRRPWMDATGERYAYRCLDWSERRDHLAGQLADEMLAHFLTEGWLRPDEGRSLALTPTGVQRLLPAIDA